jgi:hypothetical protein
VQLDHKVSLVCLACLETLGLKDLKESLVILENLDQEELEDHWDHLEEMGKEAELGVMVKEVEVVLLELKVNKAILECLDYLGQRDIEDCLVFLGNKALMVSLVKLEKMDLRDPLELKETWDLGGSWVLEVSLVLVDNLVSLVWKVLKVPRAPWDLWVGLEILELQDHQGPLALLGPKDQLDHLACLDLLGNQDFRVFLVLMVCLV